MLFNFLFLDSEDEDLINKSKKLPKGKQTARKIKSPPGKDPVQYISETGESIYHGIGPLSKERKPNEHVSG